MHWLNRKKRLCWHPRTNFGENTADELFHIVISIKGAAGTRTILKIIYIALFLTRLSKYL